MPRYVIEREIPGAGKLTPVELKGISQKSCTVNRVSEVRAVIDPTTSE